MPRRIALTLLATLVLAPAAVAEAQGQKLVKTSATLTFKEIPQDGGNGCVWGIGVVVGPVPKATSYLIKYWDGYWKRVEVRTASKEQLQADANWPGVLVQGITGGGYSGPCSGGEATEGGRFSKGAKAWAIFPGKHKPKPFLNVVVKTPPPVAVGAQPKVTVTVQNGEVDLKNVSVRGLTGGGGAVGVVDRPKGLSGFSLAKNASKSFTFTVKANLPGTIDLGASARGQSKKGSASGKGSGQLHVSTADLVLTVETDPKTIRLTLDDKGKVQPQTVKVKASVTNTGETDIENVSIQSLNPLPQKKTDQLDQIAIEGGQLPVTIGRLGAQKTEERAFTMNVTGDGKYKFNGLATYAASDGGTGKAAVTGGEFEVSVPPLWMTFAIDPQNVKTINGTPYVDGGKTWYINGKLTNVSDYKRLCVYPLIPKLTGNAAALGPVDITEEERIRDVGGPFGGAVEPNHDAVLQMYVDTAPGGTTHSVVRFAPEAGVLKTADQDCNIETYKGLDKLAAADITQLTPQAGVIGVGVDQRTPVPPPRPSWQTNTLLAGGVAFGVAKGLAIETVQQGLDLVALAREQFDYATHYRGLLPYGFDQAFKLTVRASLTIATALDVYYGYLKGASNSAKGNWIERTAQTLRGASNGFFKDAKGLVEDAVRPWNDLVQKTYEKGGDSAELGAVFGQPFGKALSQLVVGEFMKVVGKVIVADELAIAGERLAEEAAQWEAKQARLAEETENLLSQASAHARASVPPGTNLTSIEKARIWGIDRLTDEALQAISKAHEVLIGVRSRAVGSMRKLLKGSVLKHENLKPKNVSKIDIEYLGFKADDFEEVRFRSYTPQQIEQIEARIQGANLTADEKAAVLKRWDTRRHEVQYLEDIRGFSKRGRIDVSFNYKDNGISRKSKRNYRGFHLEEENAGRIGSVEEGGQYFTPLQENPDLTRFSKHVDIPKNCRRVVKRILCTVTGDVDGVYITNLDGTAVDAKKMVKIYGELMEKAGWQHPETVTWIDKLGEFIFGKKTEILSDLDWSTPGAQAVVEYAPDEVSRAAYLDLKASFDGAEVGLGPQNFKLVTKGGFSDTVVR